jgi:hypothetical protein
MKRMFNWLYKKQDRFVAEDGYIDWYHAYAGDVTSLFYSDDATTIEVSGLTREERKSYEAALEKVTKDGMRKEAFEQIVYALYPRARYSIESGSNNDLYHTTDMVGVWNSAERYGTVYFKQLKPVEIR